MNGFRDIPFLLFPKSKSSPRDEKEISMERKEDSKLAKRVVEERARLGRRKRGDTRWVRECNPSLLEGKGGEGKVKAKHRRWKLAPCSANREAPRGKRDAATAATWWRTEVGRRGREKWCSAVRNQPTFFRPSPRARVSRMLECLYRATRASQNWLARAQLRPLCRRVLWEISSFNVSSSSSSSPLCRPREWFRLNGLRGI